MFDGERPGVQGDASREGLLAAVFPVPQDGMARRGQLHADLMLAASLQFHLQQRAAGEFAQRLILQPGFLCIGGFFGPNYHSLLGFILGQPVDELAALWLRHTLHDGPINLLGFAFAELLRQTSRRFASAGEDQHATDQRIQPANDAEVDVARLLILLLQIRLGQRDHACRACCRAHGGDARGLIDHQQVVVLKQDMQRRMGSSHCAILSTVSALR